MLVFADFFDPPGGIFFGLTLLFLFFLFRSLLKNYSVAILAVGILLTLINLGNENPVAETIMAVIIAALSLTVFLRFGLLAASVATTVENLFLLFPVALDASRWYFVRGLIPVMLCVVIALYGFRTSLGNRPVFPALSAED